MSLSCVAIIPARGNSKRLPNKNIKPLLGNPLIYYSISFAKAQQKIDYTVVTTDSPEIKKISEDLGIEVIDRPTDLAGDFATTASAIKHALISLEKKGLSFDVVATLQVTNPLRPKELFNDCYTLMNDNSNAESVISVSKSHLKLGNIKDGYFSPSNYIPGQRSQDMEAQFFENGLLYLSKSSLVINNGDLFGRNIVAYEIEEGFPIVDIDYQVDFDWGEFILSKNIETFKHIL